MTQWRIPISDVSFSEAEVEAVGDTLRSGWVTAGPRVREFERAFAKAHGVDDAVAVSNCTAALQLALIAAGVGPGHEVIVPSLSFVATANVVLLVGACPVFADIVSLTEPTIDPDHVAHLVSDRTRAIIPMHFGGRSCRMDEILAVARAADAAVVEDAAHAPGAASALGYLGTIGDFGGFSFFGNKNMTTGEGGMILARDPEALPRLRLLRSHGMTSLSWERYSGPSLDYDVVEAGFNYRPTEFMGALGIEQLSTLNGRNARRREVLERYQTRLAGIDGVVLPFPGDHGVGHVAPILVDPAIRGAVRTQLADQGIQTSLHYPPIHRLQTYRRSRAVCPKTEEWASREITLPLYPSLSNALVDEVCDRLVEAVRMASSAP